MKSSVIKLLKRFAVVALLAPALAMASEGVHLDKAPVSNKQENLQHGAQLFVNYCLNCHGASAVRYNKLQEIGLSEQLITDNLLFTSEKIGDLMTVALTREDAEAWFGTVPPDLSLIARAKASESGTGADYLYTYLRSFYRDPARPTGWNNKIFANVGMPHALWDLQGVQTAREVTDEHGKNSIELVPPAKAGKLSAAEYDQSVADLVSFLVWIGEPVADQRKTIGYFVLIFLAGLYVLTHALGKNLWKDVTDPKKQP
ncbi:cytochrome c [Betaproteobacteria bacterium]|nr:cytochrome c [Betaproteobacteria bacterium]GHT98697.1 cytochrome c [Betaproteobacteria bacterium]GHU02858.1 cytochrome c [Betaproteobacteria bacterium]GHU22814.1 cytochrome c [Betaproteobacteria bacterium]GHU24309.1 cytochrome c [Betaproteobacteria bacterium]